MTRLPSDGTQIAPGHSADRGSQGPGATAVPAVAEEETTDDTDHTNTAANVLRDSPRRRPYHEPRWRAARPHPCDPCHPWFELMEMERAGSHPLRWFPEFLEFGRRRFRS